MAANRAAQKVGLRIGMPLTQAQALINDLAIKDSDPTADRKGLEAMALWALRQFSPVVAVDSPDGLVMDIAGSEHLRGGEDAMLKTMIESLSGQGIAVRGAIADTWGAAHALARFVATPYVIVPKGESSKAIRNLPIMALRLPAGMVEKLNVLGFERIGELAAQPRAPLILRFGFELGRRLDQAMGRADEPIDAVHIPEVIEVSRTFAEPIGAAETIAKYIHRLTAQLCDRLESTCQGARKVDLLLRRVDNRLETIRITTARPVRDAKRLNRLLCDKIETIDPGFGIDLMRLRATEVEILTPVQTLSRFGEAPDADLTALIDTLSNRIGAERLYRMAPIASDVPERAWKRIEATAPETGQSWPQDGQRPARLFASPEPITTIAPLPDSPPVSFTWRGARHRVISADGPERIFGEWWRRDAEIDAVRDYFQVEDEQGERYWIYRAGDGEHGYTGKHNWFVHGIFA